MSGPPRVPARAPGDDFIVVVRSAGERSLGLSVGILHDQVGRDRVFVVDERPFERALRVTYEIGLAQRRRWTVTLDADVLCRDGAIVELVAEAGRLPGHYVQVEGRILDKITGLFRQAGHRVYRTSALETALQHVPAPGTVLRPEYETLLALHARGYASRRVSTIAGLHDFEQYYRDIYRKAFVHARKSLGWIPRIVERCLRYAGSDRDFEVVLKGLCDGLTSRDAVAIDTRRFEGLSEAWMTEVGLEEKPPVPQDASSMASMREACRRILASQTAPVFDAVDEPPAHAPERGLQWRHYRDRIAAKGFLMGTTSSVGSIVRKIGERLEELGP